MTHPSEALPTAHVSAPAPKSPSNAPQPAPWYKSEPWLAVEFAAFVPGAMAFFFPVESRMPFFAVSGVIALVGLAMLLFGKRATGESSLRDFDAPEGWRSE